jgi:5-hydroxyisourate hydrolase-like protein (transthyretin family)
MCIENEIMLKKILFLDRNFLDLLMTGKTTIAVYDDVHHQDATGIEYDLWRVNNKTNRVSIKHDTLPSGHSHVLIQTNTAEDLGSFEVILYTKDYFDRFNEDIQVPNSRLTIPFGVNELNQDQHLNIHIKPTSFTCTL